MMGWSWRKKAPACDSTKVVKGTDLDKEVVIKLGEAMNASHHYPGLARVFNEHQQQTATPQLLAMPDKVLKKILRSAVVERDPICVAADHPEDCSESSRGVLSVCHAIRDIARPMFYKENVFEVQVFSFDIKAVLPWLEMSAKFMSESKKDGAEDNGKPKSGDGTMIYRGTAQRMEIDNTATTLVSGAQDSSGARPELGKPSQAVLKIFGRSYEQFTDATSFDQKRSAHDEFKPLSTNQIEMLDYFISKLDRIFEQEPAYSGGFFIVPKFEPHWENLVEWLHSFHHGQVPRYSFDETSPEFCRAVSGFFDLVELKEEGRRWSLFESRLSVLRAVLAEADDRWLDDGHGLR